VTQLSSRSLGVPGVGSVNAGHHSSTSLGYSHSLSRTKSWSDTTTFGTTKTQTNTIGDDEDGNVTKVTVTIRDENSDHPVNEDRVFSPKEEV